MNVIALFTNFIFYFNHINKLKSLIMKKVMIALFFFFSFLSFTNAQNASTTQKSKTVTKSPGMTKEGKPDMRMKANKEVQSKEVDKTTKTTTTVMPSGVTKEGKPDMRLKANNVTKSEQVQVQKSNLPPPAVTKSVTQSTKSSTTTTTNNHDKVVETDAKGRTIYEGPRGGRYYITKNGNKEYIKK